MQELDLSWIRVLKVGWLIIWRGMMGGLLLGFVSGFIIGFIGAFIGITEYERNIAILVVVAIFTPIWWFLVLRMALRKQYRDFRLAVVAKSRTEAPL